MLKNLTKLLVFSTGIRTQRLDNIVRDFRPFSEDSCIESLQKIQKQKEYLAVSQSSESFVDRIEYFILYKQGSLSSKSLFIYQLIKQLELLSPSFKYGVLEKLNIQLGAILQKNLNVSNNELEVLLWFIYREFPYTRNYQFQNIAGEHTLKLFEMHDFMNKQPKLPAWEPYLRITMMLKCLGHQPQLRTDITMKDITKMNYSYLPFLHCLFPTEQACREMRRKQNLHEPFLVHICNQYIEIDQMKYDSYLQYVETIDNEQAGQEIERTFDTLSWNNFTELLELYTKSYHEEYYDQNLAYKISQLFWRVCETKKLSLESAIKMLELISANPKSLGIHENSICSRILQLLSEISMLEFSLVPQSATIALFESTGRVEKIPINDKIQFMRTTLNKISKKIEWSKQDAQLLEAIVKETDEKLSTEVTKYLKIAVQ